MKSPLEILGFAVAALLATVLGGIVEVNAEPFLFAANIGHPPTVTRIDLASGRTKVIMDASDKLTSPTELTLDAFGNLYVANSPSPDILRRSPDGSVIVFVSGAGTLSNPHGLAVGPQGDLFIAEDTSIYRFNARKGSLAFFADVSAADPVFNNLEDIEFDRAGNLFAASGENAQGRGAVVKFDSQGNASIVARRLDNPRDLAIDDLGHIYTANRIGRTIDRITLATGSVQLFADLSEAAGDPRGIKTDLQNNVYVVNSSGDIRRWKPDGTGGDIEFHAGAPFSEALAFFSGGPDKDRDGVPDDQDKCANSDLRSTVVIDRCSTDVPNALSKEGCTISDRIANCASDGSNHGQFVSCVGRLTNKLQNAGTITCKQKGAIQRCAARANVP